MQYDICIPCFAKPQIIINCFCDSIRDVWNRSYCIILLNMKAMVCPNAPCWFYPLLLLRSIGYIVHFWQKHWRMVSCHCYKVTNASSQSSLKWVLECSAEWHIWLNRVMHPNNGALINRSYTFCSHPLTSWNLIRCLFWHNSDVTWAAIDLISQVTQVFVQKLDNCNTKEGMKALHF